MVRVRRVQKGSMPGAAGATGLPALLRTGRLSAVFLGSGLLAGCSDVGLSPLAGNTGLIGADLGAIAVVTGDYDREEELLADRELEFSLFDGWITGPSPDAVLSDRYEDLAPVEELLGDPDSLDAFDLIFFNCGVRGTGSINPAFPLGPDMSLLSSDILDNLRDWVENGGSLYVSDQSYNLLEAAFPDLIDFEGDDALVNSAAVGGIATITADVVNAALGETLETPQVTFDFPVSHWAVPLQTSGDAWVRADVPVVRDGDTVETVAARPLLTQMRVGLGQVTFSSFHNLPGVNQARWDLQIYLLRSLKN